MFGHFRFLLKLYFFSFTIILGAFLHASASEVLVVLDTSGSMLSYYDEINGKVLEEISKKFIKKGDGFHLISFDKSPHLELSQVVNSTLDFSHVVSRFSLIRPLAKDSNFLLTLDFLEDYIAGLPSSYDKKLIFISDGFFTCFSKDSDYFQEDFDKKLNDFSTHLEKLGNVQSYYIKLPINDNQIVLDLKNKFSSFVSTSVEMTEIMAYPLISPLPFSLQEYLQFDDLEEKESQNEAKEVQQIIEEKELVKETEETIHEMGEKELEKKIEEDAKNIEITTQNIEVITQNATPPINIRSIYVFLAIVGVIVLLIFSIVLIFLFITRKKKKQSIIEDTSLIEEYSQIAETSTAPSETNIEKNEVLLSSTEEYLHINGKDDAIYDEKNKGIKKEIDISKQSPKILKELQKDEKILLTVKTLETKLSTEYSSTLFTLSAETKRAFDKKSIIENMTSLLNASYVDKGDAFYRFKNSLYTKRYVKNIDVTKDNYLEMFVLNQRRSIGMRNTHSLISGKTFYLGGGRRDDFLIFLVPIPHHLASIHYDGKEIIFNIFDARYFPYEVETEVKNPIDRFFVINSDKNYPIHFMFRLYEKENISAYSNNTVSN